MLIKCGSIAIVLLMASAVGRPFKSDDNARKKPDRPGELQVGDVAPDWQLTGSDGKEYRLADYRDKQAVVMSWYPMALTGG